MSTESSPSIARFAGAIVLLALVNTGALAAIATIVPLLSEDEPLQWFQGGGYFMYALAAVAGLQLLLGMALGVLQLFKPPRPALFLLTPTLAAMVGLGGVWMGLEQAASALETAPPDATLLLWSSALTYAEIPRQLALAVMGAGGGVMVVAGSTAALVRHGQVEQRGALRQGLTVAVVTLFVAAVALALAQMGFESRPAAVLWLTFWLGLHGLVLALGAPAIAGLARSPDAAARATAFGAALLSAIGLSLGAGASGLALHSAAVTTPLQTMVKSPPDQAGALLTASVTAQDFSFAATLAFFAAALLIGALALALGIGGLWAWLRRRFLSALLMTLLGLGVYMGHQQVQQRQRELHDSIVARVGVPIPDALRPATSLRVMRYNRDLPVVALHEGLLYLGETQLGTAEQAATLAELGAELRRGRPGADSATGETWPAFALALDRDLSATQLASVLVALRQAGARELSLLLLPPDAATTTSPTAALSSPGLGSTLGLTPLLIDVRRERQRRWLALPVALATLKELGLEHQAPGGYRPLDLTVILKDGAVHIAYHDERPSPLPAKSAGELDRVALEARLIEIKDYFPEATRSRVLLAGGDTLQQVVALLGALQETTPEKSGATSYARWQPRGRELFPEIVIVADAEVDGLEPGALRDRLFPPTAAPEAESTSSSDDTSDRAFKVTLREPIVRGSLGRELISEIARRKLPAVRECYRRELASSPSLEGMISVKILIGATGRVSTAVVLQSTVGNDVVERCTLGRVRRWIFHVPADGGITVVTYTFDFKQGGAARVDQ